MVMELLLDDLYVVGDVSLCLEHLLRLQHPGEDMLQRLVVRLDVYGRQTRSTLVDHSLRVLQHTS